MNTTIERIAADILIAALSVDRSKFDITAPNAAENSAKNIASAYRVIHQAVLESHQNLPDDR